MSATNRCVADLLYDVEDDRLEVRPFFQRRLVWTNSDKELFIETVLKGLPFPEIFVATAKLDQRTAKRKTWLVDGQQRITTLLEYVKGSTDIICKTIPQYASLAEDEKAKFLDYKVAVRDLGLKTELEIKEIFRRINSTDYALKAMEVLNAMYNGVYSFYCQELSNHQFFKTHKVFSAANHKRMYDVTFCVILVTTILTGYYRRDEKNEEYLGRYNDEFPDQNKVNTGLEKVFAFVERCGFEETSRVWGQTDLFTLLVELYSAIVERGKMLDPDLVGPLLKSFYLEVDTLYKSQKGGAGRKEPARPGDIFKYLKAATKATNDKYARIERAQIIAGLLESTLTGTGPKKPQSKRKSSATTPNTPDADS